MAFGCSTNHCPGVGVGARGSSAVSHLMEHGKVPEAELWCLDTDRSVLEACSAPNVVLVPKEGTRMPNHELNGTSSGMLGLKPEDLDRIIGPGMTDRDGFGNVIVGDCGVAFVLASAGSVPGGSGMVQPCPFSPCLCTVKYVGCCCRMGGFLLVLEM